MLVNRRRLQAAAIVLSARAALAQEPARTPREGDAEAVAVGRYLFQTTCAECHGIDAKGVFGPDLTVAWVSGATDERLFRTIRQGVPATSMPASTVSDDQIRAILDYLRTLSASVPPAPARGDAGRGERQFWTRCGACHRIDDRGGYLGPDLTRIGSSRSRDALARDIREASRSTVPGYRAVTLVLADGTRVRGARKSEDAYSIRIMNTREELQGFVKSDLRDVVEESRSLMPDFTAAQLSDADLDDLLQFLTERRSPEASRR